MVQLDRHHRAHVRRRLLPEVRFRQTVDRPRRTRQPFRDRWRYVALSGRAPARRGLKAYAYVLSGGGILILYLSDYAAYNFYHLIGQTLAFLLMAAVTTAAVLLAVRLNALSVAILGLIGGFLTPVMLSTGVDNEIALF